MVSAPLHRSVLRGQKREISHAVVRKKSICCGLGKAFGRYATMVFSKVQYKFGKVMALVAVRIPGSESEIVGRGRG